MELTQRDVLIAIGHGGTTDMAAGVWALLESSNKLSPVPDVGGVAEVAAELGVTRQTLGHWIAGRRCPLIPLPDPIVRLLATPVWDMETIREYAAELNSARDEN